MSFSDRLVSAIGRVGSPVCVGLDPVLDRIPRNIHSNDAPETVERFSLGVIDSVSGVVAAIKPQSACYERHGSPGVRALERAVAHARERGLIVILDAKRGDIGISARHYAAAAKSMGADAITVNAYLGPETVEPYLDAGLGVFVLVRTSNPGSDAVQSCALADGRSVAEMMADHVRGLGSGRVGVSGLSDVGAVVGATKSADARALRERMPDAVFLVPGYGAQGGSVDDIRAMLRPGEPAPSAGVLVTASRSVIYAGAGDDWRGSVRGAAEQLRDDLSSLFTQ